MYPKSRQLRGMRSRSVLMMATLKAYFQYQSSILCCGIPSVTILGTKADWEDILSRIDKLSTFGDEPAQWAQRLGIFVERFVRAFDGKRDVDFWQRICAETGGGSMAPSYSGWITAFCWWNTKGERLGYIPSRGGLFLDGVPFGTVEIRYVPAGLAEVDVSLDDNSEKFDCMMVAGHVAYPAIGEQKDGIYPLPGWFMFDKKGWRK